MSGPLVSVLMITYNQANYIAAAIEGVLNQEVPFQYELVIGEDCSTDGTREIVSTYQKNYPEIIRVITSDRNVGMVRNFFGQVEHVQENFWPSVKATITGTDVI